jgi:hypothetical protein
MSFDRTALMNVPLRRYAEIRQEIRSGDLLLCAGSSIMSRMIQRATASMWSHVALIARLDSIERVMVLESVESIGVRTVPLSHYVRDYNGPGRGYKGDLLIARHAGLGAITTQRLRAMSQFAVDLFGSRYDTQEILRIAERIMQSSLKLDSHTAHDLARDGTYICSEYVWECYRRIGLEIAHDSRGFIAPADFANDPRVCAMWRLQAESGLSPCGQNRPF